MRVLHVIPSIADCYGGPSKVVLDTCKALRDAGIEAEIATTNADEAGDPPIEKEQPVVVDEVPVYFFARQWRYKFSWDLTNWLDRNVRQYDLLHLHALFSYSTAAAAHFARKRSIPYIVLPHGMLAPWAIQQKTFAKRTYLKLIEERNLNRAAAVQFTAEEELRSSAFRGQSNFVLPYIIDLANQQHGNGFGREASSRPRILFLSRLHAKKGIDLLIQALGKLAADGHDFQLLLAGSGDPDYENEVKDLVQSNQLAERTKFMGFVRGAEKTSLLHEADLFVLPSYEENFGIAVTEAMAAGLPVVISDKVNICDEVRSANAGLVIPPEVEALRLAIARLLNDRNLRVELGARGTDFVKSRFGKAAIADQTVNVYEDILRHTRTSGAWRDVASNSSR